MTKNYTEESKMEDVLEHLDGMLDKLWSVVVQEICDDFMSMIMLSIFIESRMSHKAL